MLVKKLIQVDSLQSERSNYRSPTKFNKSTTTGSLYYSSVQRSVSHHDRMSYVNTNSVPLHAGLQKNADVSYDVY